MREKSLTGPAIARPAAEALARSAAPQTHIPLLLVSAITVALLYVGASKSMGLPVTDLVEYRCYGLAFWGGQPAVDASHLAACASYLGSTHTVAFHILPREYGPLALIPFSLPLLGPGAWYPWLFATEMIAVVGGIAWLLHRYAAAGSVHAWLFYVMLGSMATAAARFDVVPAACVLAAFIARKRSHHALSWVLLAVGVALKFYPLLLVPLWAIDAWRNRASRPFHRGPLAFGLTLAVPFGLGALLDPSHVLDPVRFMGSRCVELESTPASVSYVLARLTGSPVTFSNAYHAVCQQSPALASIGAGMTALALAGMAAVLYLNWRGRLALPLASIALLILAILGAKVFSPQYLLWVSPLLAMEYGLRSRVFIGWGLVCLLTTVIFPLGFDSLPLVALHLSSDVVVPIAALLRNLTMVVLLLCGAVVSLRGDKSVATSD